MTTQDTIYTEALKPSSEPAPIVMGENDDDYTRGYSAGYMAGRTAALNRDIALKRAVEHHQLGTDADTVVATAEKFAEFLAGK